MQLVGVEHRLVLLGEGNQQQGEEEWAQPRQLCGALSDDNFCAALRKVKEPAWSLLHQILGESSHGGRGAVLDVGEELGRHGMEVGSPQRRGEVGR